MGFPNTSLKVGVVGSGVGGGDDDDENENEHSCCSWRRMKKHSEVGSICSDGWFNGCCWLGGRFFGLANISGSAGLASGQWSGGSRSRMMMMTLSLTCANPSFPSFRRIMFIRK